MTNVSPEGRLQHISAASGNMENFTVLPSAVSFGWLAGALCTSWTAFVVSPLCTHSLMTFKAFHALHCCVDRKAFTLCTHSLITSKAFTL